MNTHRNIVVTLAVWIICLVVLCSGGLFLYRIYSRDAEAQSLISESKDSLKKDEQLAVVRAALRESSATLGELETIFIPEDSVSSFIDSLETLATREGVTINLGSLSIDPVAGSTVAKQLRVRASTAGSWRNVLSFTSALESLPQAVVVQTAAFNKELDADPSHPSSTTRWNAVLDISILILPH